VSNPRFPGSSFGGFADGPPLRRWFASIREENAVRDSGTRTASDNLSLAVLVAHASKHGSTAEVAADVAATLRACGLEVDVRPAAEVAELTGYGAVVLGGALYMGRLHADARRFLARHRETLTSVPLAVFAMGPRSLAEADVAGSRAQLDRALAALPELEPVSVAIFGGVLEPAKLRFPFSRMPAVDARDPDAIRAWAERFAALLAKPAPAVP
jgi:menaquinone-dependent protoporphyrinogen oxidase